VTSTQGKLQQVVNLGGLSVKELVQRVVAEIQSDNCLGQAAQLAYYAIFALFPFMLFLITLVGHLPIPNLTEEIMNLLGAAIPENALSLVESNVKAIVSNQRSGLLSFGIVLAIWSASSAITSIIDTLNRAYNVNEGRPLWKVRGLAILLTLGLAVFIILTMLLLVFGPQIGGWVATQVGLGHVFQVAWNIVRWPIIIVLMMMVTAVLYYFAPDVEQDWKWLTPGSVFAIIAIIATSLGFSYYVNNVGSYNKTYGSIGAVIVLLTWMYLSGFFFLVGGEFNSVIDHAAAGGKEAGEKEGA